tara:strand:+ start:2626 stop:4068 length:1443 start_codon:yes stop_codon:yes gene_type:complete
MAASVIVQQPIYNELPVGQEIIFTVSNADAVATETKVKFCVEVHISNDTMPVIGTSTHLVGTFKATPNNAGVGIFDLRNVIENYVAADNRCHTDNTGTSGPSYKGTFVNESTYPMHIIDKMSLATHSVSFMVLDFYVEFLGATNAANEQNDDVVRRSDGTEIPSDEYSIFNGYVKYTDVINEFNNNFGYETIQFNPGFNTRRYLTNAPMEQYANYNDYGTIAFYQPNNTAAAKVNRFEISYFDSDNVQIGVSVVLGKGTGSGAYSQWIQDAPKQIIFLGCFPGNLQNWSAVSMIPSAAQLEGGHIIIEALDIPGGLSLQALKINVNCPQQKDFEPIRLCWLNQWGAWDYYTFIQKSSRSYKTKGTTYTQLEGSWNEATYRVSSHRGGQKTFRVNATEKITINTDFVSEDFNVMFEELTNSPEVYLLEGYQTDQLFSSLNNYVTPVTISSKGFNRKTKVNDNLIQYSFKIEKTKTLRTQSI